LHQVAGREAIARGRLDPANRPALQRLADLERRDVAFARPHAAAHVGIDRHPKIAHLDLAVRRRRHVHLGDRERVGGRDAFGAVGEPDLA